MAVNLWKFVGLHYATGVGASLVVLPSTYALVGGIGSLGNGLGPVIAALFILLGVAFGFGYRAVARTEGGADSGLFTGILLRYLAVVAVTAELPDRTRDLAAAMVRATAEAFWQGRRTVTSGRGRPCLVLPTRTDGRPDPEGPVELSTQLQAWMALEAAAALDRLDAAGVG